MGTHHPIRKTVTPEAAVIPDKLYFRIGDVAQLCEVPAYVLRFWETEFPQLKPNKGGTGQRLYRRKDVEMALRIKSLLYDQGYTIPGARQVFKSEAKPKEATPFPEAAPSQLPEPIQLTPRRERAGDVQLYSLREEMRALLAELSKPLATVAPAPVAVPKPLRPRLVLEPRPATAKPEKPRLQLEQRDLFGNFDDPDGPTVA
jgi:DNA-binding transcriptional MerR regulator